jgi:O-methyltransferase
MKSALLDLPFGGTIDRIKSENIPGSFAKAVVWKGRTSKIVRQLAPDRKYYLFDTFEGFPEQNLEAKEKDNQLTRFKNTNLDVAKQNIGDLTNIEFRVGYFPATAKGLESEKFAFVMLDMDFFRITAKSPTSQRSRGFDFYHLYASPVFSKH